MNLIWYSFVFVISYHLIKHFIGHLAKRMSPANSLTVDLKGKETTLADINPVANFKDYSILSRKIDSLRKQIAEASAVQSKSMYANMLQYMPVVCIAVTILMSKLLITSKQVISSDDLIWMLPLPKTVGLCTTNIIVWRMIERVRKAI